MNVAKMFRKRKLAIGLLVGVSFLTLAPNSLADDDGQIDPEKNIIAIHDSSSDEYKKECGKCHKDILSEQSLESSVPAAHVAMFPFAAGKPGSDEQCRWCHRTVDLVQGSAGNMRRGVDVILCSLCHGNFERTVVNNKKPELTATAKQFYNVGLDPANPDPWLYELACETCHRPVENSKVRGADARHIRKPIEENKAGMGVFTVLSEQEIQAIADALAHSRDSRDEDE